MVKIRFHHLLCINFHKGKGYDENFCDNMSQIIDKLNKEDKILLTFGKDDICAKCPKMKDEVCADEEKSCNYDNAVAQLLGISEGEYSYFQLNQRVLTEIIEKGKREEICANCQWNSLCDKPTF